MGVYRPVTGKFPLAGKFTSDRYISCSCSISVHNATSTWHCASFSQLVVRNQLWFLTTTIIDLVVRNQGQERWVWEERCERVGVMAAYWCE